MLSWIKKEKQSVSIVVYTGFVIRLHKSERQTRQIITTY